MRIKWPAVLTPPTARCTVTEVPTAFEKNSSNCQEKPRDMAENVRVAVRVRPFISFNTRYYVYKLYGLCSS